MLEESSFLAAPSMQISWTLPNKGRALHNTSHQKKILKNQNNLIWVCMYYNVLTIFIPKVMLVDISSGGFLVSAIACQNHHIWTEKNDECINKLRKKINVEKRVMFQIMGSSHEVVITAIGMLQLQKGPQKWVVLGPTGLFQKVRRIFI